MATMTASEIGNDHKHWLADIDRWDAYHRVWQNQIGELKKEYRKLLKTIDQHSDEFDEFNQTVESHRKRLIVDERASFEHRWPNEPDAKLLESHGENSARHDELYKAHERLKQIHHTLMAGLALLKHEPYRDE